MMIRLLTAVALLLCTACGEAPSSAPGSKRLRVQLDWVPEPEFGGLYAAQQDGLFAAAGLDVEIIKGGAGTPTPQLTADGVCDIGLMSADQLLQLRARDGALVGFYATFIETPYALMAHDANPAQSLEQLWTGGGGKPYGKVAELIDRDLGGYDNFVKEFKAAATTQFGSGWAWLSYRDGKLVISKTPNAETPMTEAGTTPLLTMDVWEHAYYIDYQNRRPDYIDTFLSSLVNWDFANQNLADAGA